MPHEAGRSVEDISIAEKLSFVVGIMASLILGELATLRFAMHTLSAARAFVGGEGPWSRSQKSAALSLQRSGNTEDEADFQAFLTYGQIPRGGSPGPARAVQAFARSGVHRLTAGCPIFDGPPAGGG